MPLETPKSPRTDVPPLDKKAGATAPALRGSTKKLEFSASTVGTPHVQLSTTALPMQQGISWQHDACKCNTVHSTCWKIDSSRVQLVNGCMFLLLCMAHNVDTSILHAQDLHRCKRNCQPQGWHDQHHGNSLELWTSHTSSG